VRQNKVTKIQYTKTREGVTLVEKTERTIIPTVIPGNIHAIDVTELDDEHQQEMSELYEEYAAYMNTHLKLAFSFENWLSHSKSVEYSPNWRTFRPDQTEEIA